MATKSRLYSKDDWARRGAARSSPKLAKEKYRSEARRDFARLVHCPSYRRLQGKTQLFPSHESDFFRNRLTHSIEVAQIAKSIAIRLNSTEAFLKPSAMKIDTDVVEFAGLAHDVGHPPFGHNGEEILDEIMRDAGGFEGNAQTLRILARLEKKETETFPSAGGTPNGVDDFSRDVRMGLNLSARCIASIVKYDKIIPSTKGERKKDGSENGPRKGIYSEEKDVLDFSKSKIGVECGKKFKTVECHIMDIADDIAYSTYDIEDAIKAGFITPIGMLSMGDQFKEGLVSEVEGKCKSVYSDKADSETNFTIDDLNNILFETFRTIFDFDSRTLSRLGAGVSFEEAVYLISAGTERASSEMCENGYIRTAFTSELVGEHIRKVEFLPNVAYPAQSIARLDIETFKKVETLKRFAFNLLIESPRLKMADRRGKEMISKVFDTFKNSPELLPDDWKLLHDGVDDRQWRMRVVCDYIAGMTDRYCVEIYSRITGENPMTIWKPH